LECATQLLRQVKESSKTPYIDVPERSLHTPAHSPRIRRFMKRTDSIANEAKFQEWLASVFESERQRLRESWRYTSFEVVKGKQNEGDTAS